jgi:hypothetical protein
MNLPQTICIAAVLLGLPQIRSAERPAIARDAVRASIAQIDAQRAAVHAEMKEKFAGLRQHQKDLKQQAREQVVETSATLSAYSLAAAREDLSSSLEAAKAKSREQTRKLAEEAREAARHSGHKGSD